MVQTPEDYAARLHGETFPFLYFGTRYFDTMAGHTVFRIKSWAETCCVLVICFMCLLFLEKKVTMLLVVMGDAVRADLWFVKLVKYYVCVYTACTLTFTMSILDSSVNIRVFFKFLMQDS